jgi:hypothetical protein
MEGGIQAPVAGARARAPLLCRDLDLADQGFVYSVELVDGRKTIQ